MSRQLWIADACRKAGLKVIEVQGWRDRGSATFAPHGVVLHHTAGAATGDMPSLPVLVSGRADLPGPLAQFGLARSGTVYVIASGRANHAGAGGWHGLSGNTSVWGIEAENTGSQPWPAAQLDAYVRLAAVLATRTPFDAAMVCAHREWAPTRKVDPAGIDMDAFRRRVTDLLAPPPQEDDDMPLIMWDPNTAWLVDGGRKVRIDDPAEKDALKAAGVKEVVAPKLAARTPEAS